MTTYAPGRTPYLYSICWTKLNTAYVGVRYGQGCHPDDLWTSYFTSSKYVAAFREKHGEPDQIDIIDTFLTIQEAVASETDVISTFELHKSPVFLNKNCSGAIFADEDVRAKMSAAAMGSQNARGNKGITRQRTWVDEEHHAQFRENVRVAHINKLSPERKQQQTWMGEVLSVPTFAEVSGLPLRTIRNLLNQGLSFEQIVLAKGTRTRSGQERR